MVLQNVIWDKATEETKELYYRGLGITCLDEKIQIDYGGGLVTDTYMNLLDIEVWKKYTFTCNVNLNVKVQGRGQIVLQIFGENTDKIMVSFECEEAEEVAVPIPNEWKGKIYFEIIPESKVNLYKSCYETSLSVCQNVKLAVVICTYKREFLLRNLLSELEKIKHELQEAMEVFVVDNASEVELKEFPWIHLYHNPNTGGSGGFGRGMDEVINCFDKFSSTHVLLMDDDVEIREESILRLYAFLSYIKDEYANEIVAGRMFRKDRPWIQYTAAEIWNGGDLRHIGFDVDMRRQEHLESVNDNSEAEYSGWWFCCIPYEFVKDNRPLPFFLHCDDVEYGLRHGGTPIILNGIQVWHETYEYRQSPVIAYYDMRNSLFVNEIIALKQGKTSEEMEKFYCNIFKRWKEMILEYHLKEDWIRKYCVTLAVYDWLRGKKRLERVNANRLYRRLIKMKASKAKNALAWRYVEYRFKRKIFKEIKNVQDTKYLY